MTLGAAHALAALLLEHPDLRPTRFAVDDTDNPDVGNERRSGKHLAAFLFQDEHLVNRHFVAGRGVEAIDGDDVAGADFDLPATALNDCEHGTLLRLPWGASGDLDKESRVARKQLARKGLGG
jgi:hypothetical protein